MLMRETDASAPSSESSARGCASTLSDTLHRALAASGDVHCWLLIDPAVRPLDDDQPLARALAAAGAQVRQLPSPHRDIDHRVMPCIALLDSAHPGGSAVLRLSIEEAVSESETDALNLGAGRRIGGWLQANASPAALAHHLARSLLHRRPGGRTTLLRWTDPAVLWAAWPLLNSEQQATLLGPISCYHLLDPGARLLMLEAPERRFADAAPIVPGLAITQAQWDLLDAVGPLNGALRLPGAADLAAVPLRRARDVGLAAILRARGLGFTDARDLTAFAWRAITVHERFDAHPLVAERLAQHRADDCFTALVDDLGNAEWSRIARESAGAATGQNPVSGPSRQT